MTTRVEADELKADCALVKEVEGLELRYRWEQEQLEAASERVYRQARALMAPDRGRLIEIRDRRRMNSE